MAPFNIDEVKELLWVLEKSFNGNITIKTANLKNQDCEYFDLYINGKDKEWELRIGRRWSKGANDQLTILFAKESKE